MVDYSLDVVSHHEKFAGKTFLKYHVDQIDTVGVWGDEPFEIRFKNNTYKKVQVKISVDGTDILTGQPANTEVNKDMWVVQPYGTLSLKAWTETQNGGARFVFASANNSVALHTHGDMSNRGIIAAAVFIEGQPAPTYTHPSWDYYNFGTGIGDFSKGIGSRGSSLGGTYNSNVIRSNSLSASYNSASLDISPISENSVNNSDLESLVAVGAGEHVEQKITYVQGLVKPVFNQTLRLRYLWWDDLKTALRANNVPLPHPSGFPGDKPIMSLGSTPRMVKHTSAKRIEEVVVREYNRF